MPARQSIPYVLHVGRAAVRSVLIALLALTTGASISTPANAAVGHELREESKIVYGSTEDGGAISTVYDAATRRANEIARTASDPERRRLFLVTRPYTDGTVRVYRVDLTDGTSAERLPEANIVARANFAAARNAVVDPKDGHLWIFIQDAANVLRLIRVDPDSGTIRANVALPTTTPSNFQAAQIRIDPVGDRLWLSASQYIANVPLAPARAEGATEAIFRMISLRQRTLYSAGTFSAISPTAAGVAFAQDDRNQGAGNTGPWTYVATKLPAGLLWISDQTATDLANPALNIVATPALSPDNGLSEGYADTMAVDPDSGDILQAITTPNGGNYGRIIRLDRDTRTPAATAAPGVVNPSSGLFRFAGDDVWWRGQRETMILDRDTLAPRATVPTTSVEVPSESELLLDGRLYVPVADGVSVRELVEVEIPDAGATPIGGRRITAGTIEWGVRQSWRTYIAGAASGHVDLTAPASAPEGVLPSASNYAYRFPDGEGVYDPEDEELRLTAKGGLRFRGHYTDGVPILDVRFADPTVIVRSDGTAVLTATGRDSEGNELGNWPFVNLDVTGITAVRDGDARTVTYTAVPTTLRYDGQAIFQNNYSTGSAFDPITFSFTYHESETATWDPATTPQTRNGIPVDPDDPDGDPDPDGDGDPTEPSTPGTPTATTSTSTSVTTVTSPARAASRPRIAVRGAQRLRRGVRRAEIARITCRSGPCRIAAPSSVGVTVGGVAYRARVTGPRRAHSGRTVALNAILPVRALARMERSGRAAVVSARVRVTSAGGGTSRAVRRIVRVNP